MSLKALKDILAADGCNQADQVTTLITACLQDGETDGKKIVRRVADLGFEPRFVGIQLSHNAGSIRGRYLWYKDADGAYRLH